jgi:hypothetical protein
VFPSHSSAHSSTVLDVYKIIFSPITQDLGWCVYPEVAMAPTSLLLLVLAAAVAASESKSTQEELTSQTRAGGGRGAP